MQIKIHQLEGCQYLDYRKIKDLQGNLKSLKEINYNKLKLSLLKHGFTFPGFVWRDGDDYWAIDLHQRLRVMGREDMNDVGNYEIPVVYIPASDISDAKTKLLIATSQYGTMEQEGFDEFIADLPEAEILEAVQFDALPFLSKEDPIEVEEDEPPEVDESEPPKSKLGEIYQLGEHRLMCGSSTSTPDVRKLMNGQRAILFATDPPYLVDYDGTNHPHKWGEKEPATKNKDWSDSYKDWDSHKTKAEDSSLYTDFCRVAIAEAVLPNAAWYCWHAGTRAELVIDAWGDNGVLLHQQIIWVKDRPVLTRSYYMYQHEPCYYGWIKGNMPPKLKGDNPRSVWNIPTLPPGQHNEHPTSKPVELFARSIVQHTQPGEICYEPFAGSGSQLIAAEQLGRKCYAMDNQPIYIDVIRRRYQKFITGAEDGWEAATPRVPEENTGQ